MDKYVKNILIYGDSHVYGKVPKEEKRFSINDTFPGVLRNILGNDYNVVIEGLRGRMIAGENPLRPERNGLEQFGPIFASHLPLDLVVLMLGTNDCNRSSQKSKEEFKQALGEYLVKMKTWSDSFTMKNPQMLIVVPPSMISTEIVKDSIMETLFGEQAEEKSKKLSGFYKEFCEENNISFFDAGTVCTVAKNEGVHLDLENNLLLGQALASEILKII